MRLYKVRLDDGRVFVALGAYTQQAEKAVTTQTGTKNIVTCEPIALDAYEITDGALHNLDGRSVARQIPSAVSKEVRCEKMREGNRKMS